MFLCSVVFLLLLLTPAPSDKSKFYSPATGLSKQQDLQGVHSVAANLTTWPPLELKLPAQLECLCIGSELFLQAWKHRTGWAGSPVCCVPAGRDGVKPFSEFDFELQPATKGRTDSYNGLPAASETSNTTRRVTNRPHPSPDNLCYLSQKHDSYLLSLQGELDSAAQRPAMTGQLRLCSPTLGTLYLLQSCSHNSHLTLRRMVWDLHLNFETWSLLSSPEEDSFFILSRVCHSHTRQAVPCNKAVVLHFQVSNDTSAAKTILQGAWHCSDTKYNWADKQVIRLWIPDGWSEQWRGLCFWKGKE